MNYGTIKEKIGKANSKQIQQINLNTEEIINEFCSITEAEKITIISHISAVCLGKYKHAGGYGWKFKEIKEEV